MDRAIKTESLPFLGGTEEPIAVADLAQLNIVVSSGEAGTAKRRLDDLTDSGERAERQAARTTRVYDRMDDAVGRLSAAVDRLADAQRDGVGIVERLTARQSRLEDAYGRSIASTRRLGDETRRQSASQRRLAQDTDRIGASMDRFGRTVLAVAGSLGVLAVARRGVTRFLDEAERMVDLAAQAEETRSAFRFIFSDIVDVQESAVERIASLNGRLADNVRDFQAQVAGVLGPQGFDQQQIAGIANILSQLGIDLASFFNKADTQALQAFLSGLAGETEPLRRFGIDVRVAQIEQEALRLGLIDTTEELGDQERALAAVSIAMRSTTDKVGDAFRTQDSFTNRMRRMEAGIEDVRRSLGSGLTEAINGAIDEVGGLDDALVLIEAGLRTTAESARVLIEVVGGIGAAIRETVGPLGAFSRENEQLANLIDFWSVGRPLALAEGLDNLFELRRLDSFEDRLRGLGVESLQDAIDEAFDTGESAGLKDAPLFRFVREQLEVEFADAFTNASERIRGDVESIFAEILAGREAVGEAIAGAASAGDVGGALSSTNRFLEEQDQLLSQLELSWDEQRGRVEEATASYAFMLAGLVETNEITEKQAGSLFLLAQRLEEQRLASIAAAEAEERFADASDDAVGSSEERRRTVVDLIREFEEERGLLRLRNVEAQTEIELRRLEGRATAEQRDRVQELLGALNEEIRIKHGIADASRAFSGFAEDAIFEIDNVRDAAARLSEDLGRIVFRTFVGGPLEEAIQNSLSGLLPDVADDAGEAAAGASLTAGATAAATSLTTAGTTAGGALTAGGTTAGAALIAAAETAAAILSAGGASSGIGAAGGAAGAAKGAVVASGIFAFAQGGVPSLTNTIQSSPTFFPMAGGRMGVLAEAGREEGIFPLDKQGGGFGLPGILQVGGQRISRTFDVTRLPNGDLGVSLDLGGAQGFASGSIFDPLLVSPPMQAGTSAPASHGGSGGAQGITIVNHFHRGVERGEARRSARQMEREIHELDRRRGLGFL